MFSRINFKYGQGFVRCFDDASEAARQSQLIDQRDLDLRQSLPSHHTVGRFEILLLYMHLARSKAAVV